jgi:hypothetical protein
MPTQETSKIFIQRKAQSQKNKVRKCNYRKRGKNAKTRNAYEKEKRCTWYANKNILNKVRPRDENEATCRELHVVRTKKQASCAEAHKIGRSNVLGSQRAQPTRSCLFCRSFSAGISGVLGLLLRMDFPCAKRPRTSQVSAKKDRTSATGVIALSRL